MSGPIVRKYGFPNFEKIFGDRGLQHGAEDEPAKDEAKESQADQPAEPARDEAKEAGKKKKA